MRLPIFRRNTAAPTQDQQTMISAAVQIAGKEVTTGLTDEQRVELTQKAAQLLALIAPEDRPDAQQLLTDIMNGFERSGMIRGTRISERALQLAGAL